MPWKMGKRHRSRNSWPKNTTVSTAVVGYVVAYGSLMNKKSLESTIHKTFDNLEVATVHGLRRSWLASMRNNPNAQKFWVKDTAGEEVVPIFKPCYMDVTVDSESKLVAPAIPVTVDDLKDLDMREAGYNRIDISELVMTLGNDDYDGSKPVFIYMGKSEFRIRALDPEARIPYPYVEMCVLASKEYGQPCYDNFMSQMDSKIEVMHSIKLGDNQQY